jgi:hypothetical protein
MSVYATVTELTKMVRNLDKWLDKTETFAKAKNFDPTTLLTARLAPDQYPLVRQIQSACDGAKFAASHLSGKTPPKHPDTEQTWEEIRKRVRTVLTYLDTYKESDFTGAETRTVELPWLEGKVMEGRNYLLDLAVPNFFFHAVTTYAILRHNGVDLGKMDYIGSMTTRDR